MPKPTLVRWLTQNSADTRSPGGPRGRRYLSPFAAVWDELLAHVRGHRRWRLEQADEYEGVVDVTCRTLIIPFRDDLTVWVSLDAFGFTRVDALSRSRTGKIDFGVNERRIRRLLRHLDRTLEPV